MRVQPGIAYFCTLLFFGAASLANAADETAVAATPPAEPPKVHSMTPIRIASGRQPELVYPTGALRSGEEALVVVMVDIDSRGRASNVRIQGEGFGSREFHDSVRKYMREVRFEAATINGQPVDSHDVRFPFRFEVRTNYRTSNPAFQDDLRKVISLLEARDFAAAQFHAQWMLSEEVKRLGEYAVLQATLAQTGARMGDYPGALQASRAATNRVSSRTDPYEPGGPLPKLNERDFLLTRESLRPLLQLRFVLAAAQGAYLDALRAHADMQGLGLVDASDPTMVDFNSLLEAVRDEPVLTASIQLDSTGLWEHELLRRNFTIATSSPEALQDVGLYCLRNLMKLDYAPDFEWSVPKSWQNCRVRFKGSPGTKVELLELQETSSTATP